MMLEKNPNIRASIDNILCVPEVASAVNLLYSKVIID
jgi:hypothetical protein